jgi:hypothetical protein
MRFLRIGFIAEISKEEGGGLAVVELFEQNFVVYLGILGVQELEGEAW